MLILIRPTASPEAGVSIATATGDRYYSVRPSRLVLEIAKLPPLVLVATEGAFTTAIASRIEGAVVTEYSY